MKKLGLALCGLWAIGGWADGRINSNNVNSNGVALHGYDAVSYFKGDKPLKGHVQFQITQGDTAYWFSSEANKQIFLKDPKKYEPQFGGWCAYAVAESKSKVDVDPESFLIQDGRLLLFYKNWLLGNTREKWLHTDSKDSMTYLKNADTNWPSTSLTQP